jgi:hypothetical protein
MGSIRDLYVQLDLYSVYTRSVGSAWIYMGSIRELQDQLELYGVYARPVGSVGSL